jgi:hypothetical protein
MVPQPPTESCEPDAERVMGYGPAAFLKIRSPDLEGVIPDGSAIKRLATRAPGEPVAHRVGATACWLSTALFVFGS